MNSTIEQDEYFKQKYADHYLLSEVEISKIYDTAVNLYLHGFHITVLYDNLKIPKDKEWNTIKHEPEPDMTGVGIVTGTLCKNNNYIFALDIDIYRPERREAVFEKLCSHIQKELYIETTPSGGYRIIFYCNSCVVTKSRTFDFAEENDSAKHKDNVELFAGLKQVLIAPSRAINKSGEIGEYRQISKVGLLESAVLTENEIKELIEFLKILSSEYSHQKFQHNYSVPQEHRQEILRVKEFLQSQGYIVGALYNGERHCAIPDWKKNGIDDSLFNTNNLTGIILKLGKQKDKLYLNCFDIDIKDNAIGTLPLMVLEQFKPVFGESFYAEQSVSGGYHIIFKTEKPLDVNRKWKLADGSTLEVLSSIQDTINVAPTSSYIKKYQFSGFPNYGTGSSLSDISTISTVDTEAVRTFVNSLTPSRTSISFNNSRYNSNSAEDKAVHQYIRQYDSLNAVNKQIKAIFPDVINLLDTLGIKHSNRRKPLYINFFSLYADDGNNPDAILFYNNNDNPKNKWAGYSVQDFHSGEVVSFCQYLCKYSCEKFDYLMEKIGYKKLKTNIPISTEFNKAAVTYKCERYISESQQIEILQEINKVIQQNQSSKQTKIIITAPTGTGKTEMFYRLAQENKLRMILALSYTSQVLQGKSNHTVKGVLEGMCQNDFEVPEKGSIFMTYDKATIIKDEIYPSKYIMVIDEAHNLVNHSEFRDKTLDNLKELSDRCKAVIYITATPEYINTKDVDLFIRIELENQPLKQACVCKYEQNAKNFIADAVISNHMAGKIDVIYARNRKQLYKIETLIQQKSIETHVIHGDLKEESQVYSNISAHQRLSRNGVLIEDGVLLTTNLIVDGVNILDENIGNIFFINPESTTDLIQFPSRFRNGYDNYFIVISGKTPPYIQVKSRQELFVKYYNLALKQKDSYNAFIYNMNNYLISTGFDYKTVSRTISLADRYRFLDSKGEIAENIILKRVQETEARRMKYDISTIEEFTRSYNFTITEVSKKVLLKQELTEQEKEQAEINLLNIQTSLIKRIITILKDNGIERQELIKDYLKKKQRQFEQLASIYNIQDYNLSGKYNHLLSSPECMKILYRYCTGLELNAVEPLMLLYSRYSDENIYSMKRTYNNLILEYKGVSVKNDDKFYRLIELRNWIRTIKNGQDSVTLNSNELLQFAKYFNSRYAAVYNEKNIIDVVRDLNDIFDVEVKKKTRNGVQEKEYTVKDEWSFNNIQGIKFQNRILI